MTYEDFMKKFKERLRADRQGYERVRRKFVEPPKQKVAYDPPNKNTHKLQKSDEISKASIEKYKRLIMENVKQGVPTTRNIYKEHRQKIE